MVAVARTERRAIISLYDDNNPARWMGSVVASHVIPWLANDSWAWGGGTAFAKIGGGGGPISGCWSGPHIHYGRYESGTKLVDWIDSCVYQTGGATAIYNYTLP